MWNRLLGLFYYGYLGFGNYFLREGGQGLTVLQQPVHGDEAQQAQELQQQDEGEGDGHGLGRRGNLNVMISALYLPWRSHLRPLC